MILVQCILIIEIVGIYMISIGTVSVFWKKICFEDNLFGGLPIDIVQLGTAAELFDFKNIC